MEVLITSTDSSNLISKVLGGLGRCPAGMYHPYNGIDLYDLNAQAWDHSLISYLKFQEVYWHTLLFFGVLDIYSTSLSMEPLAPWSRELRMSPVKSHHNHVYRGICCCCYRYVQYRGSTAKNHLLYTL